MYCLVYQSTASPDLRPAEIDALLEKARVFNRQQGITGCLIFYKGAFLQYLEGNQLKVLSLFDQILKDRRHSNITLLTHGQVATREFPDWEMAYETLFGENALISYLKLRIHNDLEEPFNKPADTPASRQFWKQVGQMLRLG